MQQGRKYENPPIVEAVCEFLFIPSQAWNMDIVNLFREKIQKDFPMKEQLKKFEIDFQPKEASLEQKVTITPQIQFLRPDRSALVQIGPGILSINHLSPYSSWESFKPMIQDTLKAYQDAVQPQAFKRIGLRYINVINFKMAPIESTDYFNYNPQLPKSFQSYAACHMRVDIPYEGGNDRLLLTFASLNPAQSQSYKLSFLLDLDYVTAKKDDFSLKDVSQWINKAHISITDAFEACITDKCRGLFGRK